MKLETITTKLGTTRAGERSRIWIEGDRLSDVGFLVGAAYRQEWASDRLILKVDAKGNRKVSGKGAHPIIDITGNKVRNAFGAGTHVVAIFTLNTITITKGAN